MHWANPAQSAAQASASPRTRTAIPAASADISRRSEDVRLATILIFLLLILIAFAFFPIGNPSSSVFYISLLFIAVALALSSSPPKLAKSPSFLLLTPKKKELPSLLGWSALALVASSILTAALSLILSYFGLLDTAIVQSKMLSLSLPALIVAFTLAPLGEEMLFRGYLFRKIADKTKSYLAAALLSSLIFAAFHLSYSSVAELIVAFFIGLLFCYFTRRTASLVPAIAAHASFNFLSIFFAVWFA